MADFKSLALRLATEGPVKTLPTPRKVQILFAGAYLVRTTNAVYVWEHPYYPQFYVPRKELTAGAKESGFKIDEIAEFKNDEGKVVASQLSVSHASNGKSTDQVLAFSPSLNGKAESLRDLVKIDFASMDQWFEEDTPIHVHPKDPFKRIDILQSRRKLTVSVAGQRIAESNFALHLYETGLPCRYYLPLTAFEPSVLRPSKTKTKCPYKGEAEYYSVEVDGQLHEDLIWYYRTPTMESASVVELLCPYNERVDLELDGVKLERPDTPFARRKAAEKPKVA